MRSRATIAALTLWAVGPRLAAAQLPPADKPAARAEVLVLGVCHMANPGRDVFNARADDVLAPKRQAEIEEYPVDVDGEFPYLRLVDYPSHTTAPRSSTR